MAVMQNNNSTGGLNPVAGTIACRKNGDIQEGSVSGSSAGRNGSQTLSVRDGPIRTATTKEAFSSLIFVRKLP